MILRIKKNCTYSDGWHRIEPRLRRPPASGRIRVLPPCPPARTPEGVRLAERGRGGPPTRSTHAWTDHKKNMNFNARFL